VPEDDLDVVPGGEQGLQAVDPGPHRVTDDDPEHAGAASRLLSS
jgi:hypothetical protein